MKFAFATLFALVATLVSAQDKFENDVGMTCYPSQVSKGGHVNVNVWYT